MRRLVLVLLIVFFVSNLGFGLRFVEAGAPWTRWQYSFNGWYGGSPFNASPHSGRGFNSYGYCYQNPWQGPSLPYQGQGWQPYGSLSNYNFKAGPPCSWGSGWDGAAYGHWTPGGNSLFRGLYGLGRPNPYLN